MILLDTHVWVWWVQGDDRLHGKGRSALDAMPTASVGVSAISFWEVAMLARRNRLTLPDSPDVWMENATSDPRLRVLPITAIVATAAALLPELHKDPADRLIVATAMNNDCVLVTEDKTIHSYPDARIIRPVALEQEVSR